MENKSEQVNNPKHYNTGKIEVIDFIEDQNLGFHLGNVIKYICRSKHKENETQDLDKALWYLQRYIEKEKYGSQAKECRSTKTKTKK